MATPATSCMPGCKWHSCSTRFGSTTWWCSDEVGRSMKIRIGLVLMLVAAIAIGPQAMAANSRAQNTAVAADRVGPGDDSPGNFETVIVWLKTRPDLSAEQGVSGRGARLRAVVAKLRALALRDQVSLLAYLAVQRARGYVLAVHPFWLTNSVSVTATPEVISEISERSDVAAVTPDAIDVVPVGEP